MLQVPTAKPEVMDRAFLILEDWAHGQSFDPAEIDKERGVIKEEWRIRRGAGARMQDQQLPVLLKGSRYAERLPIGTTEVIDNFKHDRLKKFYTDWYRPDLMTVIAVGDFDPAAVEKMIRSHFDSIPAAKGPKPRPSFPVPDHPGTLFGIATDKEATSASISVYSKMDARDQRTVGAYREQIVERLYATMMGARFSELAQKPDAPIVGAGGGRGGFVRSKEVVTLGAGVKGDAIEKAFERCSPRRIVPVDSASRRESSSASRLNIMTGLERSREGKEKRLPRRSPANCAARHRSRTCSRHRRRIRAAPAVPSGDHAGEVNTLAKLVPDRNRVITVSARIRPASPCRTRRSSSSVMASIAGRTYRVRRHVRCGAALEPLPAPDRSPKATTKDAYGITEWQLSNGVKVVLKPTDFREDEILFRATSSGGSRSQRCGLHPGQHARPRSSAGGIGH